MSNVVTVDFSQRKRIDSEIDALLDQFTVPELRETIAKVREIKARRRSSKKWPFPSVPRAWLNQLTDAELTEMDHMLDRYYVGLMYQRTQGNSQP